MKNREDVYTKVTDRILANLADPGEWVKPWQALGGCLPHNVVSGRQYSGINLLILAMLGGAYATPQWLTYKQSVDLGGNVRKGEKGTTVVFWKILEKEKNKKIQKIPMLKTFTVFNVEQCENLDASKIPAIVPAVRPEGGVIAIAERIGAEVKYGGDVACFIPSRDIIKMPSVSQFVDHDNHEATLLYEMIHWTGSSKRLDRIKNLPYAEEELVAEIGAAIAGAVLGIPYEGLQHEQYIAGWLEKLSGDRKYIFKAARLAQQAVNIICPPEVLEEKDEEELAA